MVGDKSVFINYSLTLSINCITIFSMFLRTIKQKNKDGSIRVYLQAAESYREGEKVRQRVVHNFGRLDRLLETGKLDKLIENLIEFSNTYNLNDLQPELFNENVIYQGAISVFKKLWKDIGLADILAELLPKNDEKFDSVKAIEQMVLSRLIETGSKRVLSFNSEKLSLPDEESFDLHHFYRAMDELYPHLEAIENKLFDRRPYDLFNQKLDVVFFDTTSVKFYGEHPDKLMKRGHSKEKRSDLNQLVVGLLVDCAGIPIARKVFPGNTSDVKTLKPVMEDIKNRFNIDKVILVCDKGMISADNLKILEELGWQYIIGGKLKNEKYIKEDVLHSDIPYTFIEKKLLLKELKNEETGIRYILCYNPLEGWYEYERRKLMLDKLASYEGKDSKSLVKNKGYRSFIKRKGSKIEIDYEKIKEEVRYDGRYVLKTNCDIPKADVVDYYKSIIKVEQCFHQLKGEELIAPVYHWKERRVHTHIFICFLSLLLWQTYVEKLKIHDPLLSAVDTWHQICNLMSCVLSINGMRYLVRQEPSIAAVKGFRACGVGIPERQKLLK